MSVLEQTAVEQYLDATSASRVLFERALEALPGGNTRTTIYHEPYPVYLASGEGCRVTDVDGSVRIDFISNYTSLILGHCHPRVVEAVQQQAAKLMSAAAPNELEIELAERIRERLPSVERIRFANSGTEGTMLAFRAARAFTGRARSPPSRAATTARTTTPRASRPTRRRHPAHAASRPRSPRRSSSVRSMTSRRTRAALEPHLGDIAAVIIEPVLGAGGVQPASPEFLQFLRDLTRDAGALLVFDEVISFRVGYHGAQGELGITPDLTTLGKIIGGGLPVGACGGRDDVLACFDPRREDRVGHGGTFNANPLTMAAGLVTLAEMTPERYTALEELAIDLQRKVEAVLTETGTLGTVTRAGSLFHVHVDDPESLHLALLNHGILSTQRGMGCISVPMTAAEIDAYVDATRLSLG